MHPSGLLITALTIPLGIGIIIRPIIMLGIHFPFLDT